MHMMLKEDKSFIGCVRYKLGTRKIDLFFIDVFHCFRFSWKKWFIRYKSYKETNGLSFDVYILGRKILSKWRFRLEETACPERRFPRAGISRMAKPIKPGTDNQRPGAYVEVGHMVGK